MQAGEKLNFVRVIKARPDTSESEMSTDLSAVPSKQPDEHVVASIDTEVSQAEKDAVDELFLVLCMELCGKHPAPKKRPLLEQMGPVVAFESPYRILSEDGSYLYVVVFGHRTDDSLLDIGVSVIEHAPSGSPISGYIYQHDGSELTRTTVPEDFSQKVGEAHHFSVLAMRDELAELEESALSTNVDKREAARRQLQQLTDQRDWMLWQEELQNNLTRPFLDEIKTLTQLLKQAEPVLQDDSIPNNVSGENSVVVSESDTSEILCPTSGKVCPALQNIWELHVANAANVEPDVATRDRILYTCRRVELIAKAVMQNCAGPVSDTCPERRSMDKNRLRSNIVAIIRRLTS